MKTTTVRLTIALAALLFAPSTLAAGTAPPSCPAGTYWTRSATDSYGETTYSITAPCFVTFPADFLVTVTVTDLAWANSWVGSKWTVQDTRIEPSGATTVIGSGSAVVTAGGTWKQSFHDVYASGTPVNHRIQFVVSDLGQGASSAHGWSPILIGTVTYDPYPEAVAPPADPAAEPVGGCGTSGALPALLGLAAVLAASWPRRRARR